MNVKSWKMCQIFRHRCIGLPVAGTTTWRQVFCYPRRIRVKEFFNDFDPLRQLQLTAIHSFATKLLQLVLHDELHEPTCFEG